LNPRLGVLANNGGPTDTMLPEQASPVIDAAPASGDGECPAAGDPSGPAPSAFDQRGVPRPQLGRCDLGAVELTAPVPRTTPNAHDFGVRTLGDGPTAPVSFTLANASGAERDFTGIALAVSGEGEDEHELDASDCPVTLAPGEDCEFTVAYAPTRAGW